MPPRRAAGGTLARFVIVAVAIALVLGTLAFVFGLR
jgi:hypothetical protein